MTLNDTTLQQLALHLDGCQQQARDTVKITDQHPDMDWEDAYEIQDRILKLHLDRGARVAGLKCGLTSRAKMTQMGVTEPVFGFLVDTFAVAPGEAVAVRVKIVVAQVMRPIVVYRDAA